MGRVLQRAAAVVALILLLAFLIVYFGRWQQQHGLARATS
jgi:hypothetical protein